MKHTTLDELKTVAEVESGEFGPALSREERLARWAELLERKPERLLSTLSGTEYQPTLRRHAMRSENSPLSVAFEDPVLRAAGLKDDTYGEAKRFFDVSDWQLHEIVCYCHFGMTMTAATAARQVKAAIERGGNGGVMTRLRDALIW
jgi:hypothetical protein